MPKTTKVFLTLIFTQRRDVYGDFEETCRILDKYYPDWDAGDPWITIPISMPVHALVGDTIALGKWMLPAKATKGEKLLLEELGSIRTRYKQTISERTWDYGGLYYRVQIKS